MGFNLAFKGLNGGPGQNIPDGVFRFPNSDIETPLLIVADEAFPLYENLMRTYPHRHLQYRYKNYNYGLSNA